MISLDFARALLAENVRPLPPVAVDLNEALGCRLAESPRADVDLPLADVSAMDGYAVRAADLGSDAPLKIAFEVPTGAPVEALPAGCAARIFTGATLPAGADTVVEQELAEVQADGRVRLEALPAGSNVRYRGELFSAGATLANEGDRITPARLGVLSAGGASRVRVFPSPRVAVVMTGSELVAVDQPPSPGMIRDSNGPMLLALARRAGFCVTPQIQAADEVGDLKRALLQAGEQADLVVSCGGVSVGDYDLVPRALAELGGKVLFHKVSIKPGKPVLAARLGEAWLLGLPGNAVSSVVCWRLFAWPVGEALAGDPRAFEESPEPARLSEAVHNHDDRLLLLPARFSPDRPEARVIGLSWKGSHDLPTAADANALLVLEPGAEYSPGQLVRCYRLG